MILFDTETTGLVQPIAVPLDKQPHIIEFCAIRLNDKTLKEEMSMEVLMDPGVPISEEITKITGIKTDDIKGKPPFIACLPDIINFMFGQSLLVAHNCDFDAKLLQFELMRVGKEFHFPWPPRRLCTVEASFGIKNRRLKLGELYELATGRELKGAHRAINDVRAMAECVRWLKAKGRIRLL
jgi:DNA polymerase III epsilon subunit-like protein